MSNATQENIASFLSFLLPLGYPRSISSLALTANTVMGRGREELGWGLMGGGVDPLEGGKRVTQSAFFIYPGNGFQISPLRIP